MALNIQDIIKEIKLSDPISEYVSFRNLFDKVRPHFCKFNLTVGHRFLFRVRSHTKDDGNYFYNNISEIANRTDWINIKKFGRCNEPFQSLFYCSDNEMLSFAEVSEIVRTENKKETAYHTTSVWKMNQDLLVTPIFEPDNVETNNDDLISITKNCLEMIDSFEQLLLKDELKFLLKIIANEFTKPFSFDNKTYLFSAAVSNYLLDTISTENERMDGIVYPTCIGEDKIRNLGLNHVFRADIVGFGNKIEFVDSYRSKMVKTGLGYFETEIVKFKEVNKITGELFW